jgi:hypothetical protein
MAYRLAACVACGLAGYLATRFAGSSPLGAAVAGGAIAVVLLMLVGWVFNSSDRQSG